MILHSLNEKSFRDFRVWGKIPQSIKFMNRLYHPFPPSPSPAFLPPCCFFHPSPKPSSFIPSQSFPHFLPDSLVIVTQFPYSLPGCAFVVLQFPSPYGFGDTPLMALKVRMPCRWRWRRNWGAQRGQLLLLYIENPGQKQHLDSPREIIRHVCVDDTINNCTDHYVWSRAIVHVSLAVDGALTNTFAYPTPNSTLLSIHCLQDDNNRQSSSRRSKYSDAP